MPPGTPSVVISPDPINAANQTAVTVSGAVTGAATSVTVTVSDGPLGGADLVQTATVSGGNYSKVLRRLDVGRRDDHRDGGGDRRRRQHRQPGQRHGDQGHGAAG